MNIDLIIKAIDNDLDQNSINAVVSMIEASTITMIDYKKLIKAIDGIHENSFRKKILDHVFIHSDDDVKYHMWLEDVVPYALTEKIFENGFESVDPIVQHRLEEEVCTFPSTAVYFEGIEDIIVKSITNAKESIYIAVSWFTNPKLFKTLLKQCTKVEVKLVINNDRINNNPNGLPFNELIDAGASIYLAEVPELIHHKFCIIDNCEVINGSYNWTVSAEHHNRENIVVMKNIPTVIDSFDEQFSNLIKQYDSIEAMPPYPPERVQYDPYSYSVIHSTELVILAKEQKSTNKRNALLKKALEILPDDYIREYINDNSLTEELETEIEEERQLKREQELQSINKCKKNVIDSISDKESRHTLLSHKEQKSVEHLSAIKEKYNQAIKKVQLGRKTEAQKEIEIHEIKNKKENELAKIRRGNKKIAAEIEKNKEEIEQFKAQLDLLEDLPECLSKGLNGSLRINLKWNTADDLDLHFVMPDGQEVMFDNKEVIYQGESCILDVDAIPDKDGENPQENIYWQKGIPIGKYRCKVELYNNKSGKRIIPFTISVYTESGIISTKTYNFKNASDNDQIEIAKFIYDKKNKLKKHILL